MRTLEQYVIGLRFWNLSRQIYLFILQLSAQTLTNAVIKHQQWKKRTFLLNKILFQRIFCDEFKRKVENYVCRSAGRRGSNIWRPFHGLITSQNPIKLPVDIFPKTLQWQTACLCSCLFGFFLTSHLVVSVIDFFYLDICTKHKRMIMITELRMNALWVEHPRWIGWGK